MKPASGIPLILVTILWLPSCSLFKSEEKKPAKIQEDPRARKLVGRVASISASGQFVLVQSYGEWTVPIGSILTTQGADEKISSLRNTGEKLGQFAAADIQAGTPRVGDGVFYLPNPETSSPVKPLPDSQDFKNKSPENIPPPSSSPISGHSPSSQAP